MEEMNVDFNDPGSTPPASGVPDSLIDNTNLARLRGRRPQLQGCLIP